MSEIIFDDTICWKKIPVWGGSVICAKKACRSYYDPARTGIISLCADHWEPFEKIGFIRCVFGTMRIMEEVDK